MKRQKGSALIIALIIVLIVVGIGGAFLVDTLARSKMSQSAVQSDEAQMVCEAALEKARRALWVYKTDGTYPWNDMLSDHDAFSLDPDLHLQDYLERRDDPDFAQYQAAYYDAGVDTIDDAPPPGDPAHFFGTSMPFGEGGFMIVLRDNDDGDADPLADSDDRLLVYVTATFPDGTQRQIEALVEFQSATFSPDAAIIVDGSLFINGSPRVTGAMGKTHSNGDTTILGSSVDIDLSANATGQVILTGNPSTPSEGFNSGVESMSIPDIIPSDYKPQATFILSSTGQILNPNGTLAGTPGQGQFGAFNFAAGKWGISGNNPTPTGAYYVEGDIKITGQGNNVQLHTVTIIAEGSIETSGNAKLLPYLQGTLLLAGRDIKLNGTAGASYGSSSSTGSGSPGLIAAHEQVQILGTPKIEGVVLAKNAEDVSSLVSSGSQIDDQGGLFGGSAELRYDGGLDTILENPTAAVQVVNVRRLK